MNFQLANLKQPAKYEHFPCDPEPAEWQIMDSIDWSKSIVVEVGCGKGDWILKVAADNPDKTFLGIERTKSRSDSLLKKAKEAHLENLVSIRADAIPLLYQKAPEKSVCELYFFYPNPTPKRRQANQRFFVGSQFEVFSRVLKPGGKIYLASNIEDYVSEAKDYLENIWEFKIMKHGRISEQQIPRTNFEKKYQARKESLFELEARNNVNTPESWLPFMFK